VTLGFAGHTHTQKSVPHVLGKAEELALHILYSTYQSTLYSKIRDPDPKDPGTVHQSAAGRWKPWACAVSSGSRTERVCAVQSLDSMRRA
jgi:hypothetical protein